MPNDVSSREMDRLSASIERLADSISEMAHALGQNDPPMRADSQAALNLVLHYSQRVARRLGALDAQTPPAPKAGKT